MHTSYPLKKYIQSASVFYGPETAHKIYSFADNVCKFAFDYKLTPNLPIILTTAMSSYNRFSGNYLPEANTIQIVNHHCHISNGKISPINWSKMLETLAHELCHAYQHQHLGGNIGSRGPHRCKSWYQAIIKASPYVCGVDIASLCKPLKSVRVGKKVKKIKNKNSLTESELTHWPQSIIDLLNKNDNRIKENICSRPIFDSLI